MLAGWRGHFQGSVRDPVLATLAPVPGTPQRVSVDGWVFQGCPHTGPALTADATGVAHIAWFTGKDGGAGVFYARARPDGSFAAPIPLITSTALPAAHPAIVTNGTVAWVAINLNESSARALTISRVDPDDSVRRFLMPNSAGADHPQLIALQGDAVVAWTEKNGDATSIKLARLSEPAKK